MLLKLRERYSDNLLDYYSDAKVISKSDLLTLNVDILVPGARVETINSDNATQIKVKAIIPVANAPYSPEGEAILEKRGIFYLPGYVSNAGGILGTGLIGLGFTKPEAEMIILEYYYQRVANLLNESQRRNISPAKVAMEWVQRKAKEWEKTSFVYKGMRVLAALGRKKVIPPTLSKSLVRRWIRNIILSGNFDAHN